MKKVLLLSAACLALAAPAALAQGINLAWNECGVTGVNNFNFPCTGNTGAAFLYASVVAPAVPNFVGYESTIDVQIDAPSLNDWWALAAGGCRAGFVVSDFNFLANFNCVDPWGGAAFGGLNYAPNFEGIANRARINQAAALAAGTPLGAGTEYYLGKTVLRFNNTLTCSGCLVPACIVLNSVKLAQPAGQGDAVIANPAVSQHVTWQGGGTIECPGATPTQSNTWGQIKTLYR